MDIEDADPEVIVSLDAWRIRREQTRCDHPRSVIDAHNGTITCRDCGAYLSAFKILLRMGGTESRWWKKILAARAEVAELKAWNPTLRAVRAIEKLWRGRRSLPMCPHCKRGLWPEEFVNAGTMGVRYEVEIRRQRGITIPEGVDRTAGMVIVDGMAMGPKDHAE